MPKIYIIDDGRKHSECKGVLVHFRWHKKKKFNKSVNLKPLKMAKDILVAKEF